MSSSTLSVEAKCSVDEYGNIIEPCVAPGSTDIWLDPILQPFGTSDVVLTGKIVSLTTIPDKNQTQYNVSVDKFLKNPKPYDLITVIGDGIKAEQTIDELTYYNEPVFKTGDRVFLYLKNDENKYKILPDSFTIARDLPRGPPPEVIRFENPNEYHVDTIKISGRIQKGWIYYAKEQGGNSTVSISIYNPSHKLYLADKVYVKHDGRFDYSFKIEGELGIPGVYEYDLTLWPSLTGSTFEYKIDKSIPSPLKQFKSGVDANKIECKQDLQLVIKLNNGHPACVKSESSIKLIMLGWAKNIFLSNPCTEAFPKGLDTFEQPFSRTSPEGLVFFMKSNSTANICVRYTSPYDNTGMEQVYAEMWTGKGNYEPALSSEIVVSANPDFLPLNRETNITVTYTITALNNSKGIYWMSISQICELIPVVVGIDNSELSSSDIPVFLGLRSCPAESLNNKIIGVSDAKVDYKIRQPIGEP